MKADSVALRRALVAARLARSRRAVRGPDGVSGSSLDDHRCATITHRAALTVHLRRLRFSKLASAHYSIPLAGEELSDIALAQRYLRLGRQRRSQRDYG